MSDFLGFADRTFLVAGVANKKSVGWHVGHKLAQFGAHVVYSVRTEKRRAELARLLPHDSIFVCDVEDQEQVDRLSADIGALPVKLDGFVHSIAFANYEPASDGRVRAFHETSKRDFLRAIDVSCFSLINLANALKPSFAPAASVVAISISTTRMAALNYGYMAPAKAALDSAIVFLAKSFSMSSEVRFNAVSPGLLKTSASAGIPGYLESYLFAEAATLRKRALSTEEVADAVLFLLSARSSGINAQNLVIDAGMGVNYFDREIVARAMRLENPT